MGLKHEWGDREHNGYLSLSKLPKSFFRGCSNDDEKMRDGEGGVQGKPAEPGATGVPF